MKISANKMRPITSTAFMELLSLVNTNWVIVIELSTTPEARHAHQLAICQSEGLVFEHLFEY